MARLLVVDDNADQIGIRKLLLERAGHEVFTAASPDEAVASCAAAAPDLVLMDLRLPRAEDGLGLIRDLRQRHPKARILVLTGFAADVAGRPEAAMVDGILSKPFGSGQLLKTIGRLVCWLICLGLSWLRAADTIPFEISWPAEVVADLEMSSPGSDWGVEGREAALAELTLDGRFSQHVMLFAGAERYRYSILLGRLASGRHALGIVRHGRYSAAGSGLEIAGAGFREVHPGDEDYAVVANAPVLFARANTVGRFTDVPLLVYCERLAAGGRPVLQYSVVFSNEDGGTSTRALMARWGRTTDIEYIYRVRLDSGRATIQTRGHREVNYTGRREASHPLLIPVTDNNMVASEKPSAVRYQIAPSLAELGSAAREQVMDAQPAAWRVMSAELAREGKLRAFAVVDGDKISDPRNYVYLEARILNRGSRLSALVRLRGESRWRSANLGRADYAIERSGWVRTSLELPPGAGPGQIAGIGFECLAAEKAPHGVCRVETVRKVFFLGPDYRPGPSFWSLETAVDIPSGEIETWTLK